MTRIFQVIHNYTNLHTQNSLTRSLGVLVPSFFTSMMRSSFLGSEKVSVLAPYVMVDLFKYFAPSLLARSSWSTQDLLLVLQIVPNVSFSISLSTSWRRFLGIWKHRCTHLTMKNVTKSTLFTTKLKFNCFFVLNFVNLYSVKKKLRAFARPSQQPSIVDRY